MLYMRKVISGLSFIALLHMSGIAGAADDTAPTHNWPQLGVETAFNIGPGRGLYNFTSDGEEGVWLQDMGLRWYYAKIAGPCDGLFNAIGIGYNTHGSSRFDKSAKLIVRGWECGLSSLVTSDKPPSRKELKARDKARQFEKYRSAREARAARLAAKAAKHPKN